MTQEQGAEAPSQEEPIFIILQPEKFMGPLTHCDRCDKYVAEKCSDETYDSCEK